MYGTTSYLNKEVDYKLHRVAKGETLDIIALTYYNNPTFFWIIADYNRILDCMEDLEEGQLIYIPNISRLEFL